MSYAIIDVRVNQLVDTTPDEFGALEHVKKMYPRATPLPLVKKSELLEDPVYKSGSYITVEGMECELVEKKMIIDPGMIYNSWKPEIKVIGKWKTTPIADNLLKTKNTTEPSVSLQDKTPRVIDTGFGISNEAKMKDVYNKVPVNYPNTGYVYPSVSQFLPQVPAKQSLPTVYPKPPVPVSVPVTPATVQVPVAQIPAQQFRPSTTSTYQNPMSTHVPVVKQPPKVPFLGLNHLAANPMIFSIGSAATGQKDKIGQVLQHQIATGILRDEDVIIISNGNTKNTETWAKMYPQGLVYETLDNDILQYLIMSLSTPQQKKQPIGTFRNIVVFDHCLTRTHINLQFLKFLDSVKNNQVRVVIMTEDKDLIRSDISKKFDYMFIHSFNYTMSMTHSEIQEFVKKHDFLKSATLIENDMMDCFKNKNCIAFDNTQSNKMFQF